MRQAFHHRLSLVKNSHLSASVRLCRTILVVDEPPMGSDVYPENPEDSLGFSGILWDSLGFSGILR